MGVDCLRHASCPICSGTMESLPDGELGLAQGARICGACAMSCRGAVDSSSTCSSYVSSACATERLCVCQSSPDARAVSHHWHCARRPSSRRRGPPDHPSRGPVPTWHSSGTEASRPRLSSPLARSHPERSRSADKSAALLATRVVHSMLSTFNLAPGRRKFCGASTAVFSNDDGSSAMIADIALNASVPGPIPTTRDPWRRWFDALASASSDFTLR